MLDFAPKWCEWVGIVVVLLPQVGIRQYSWCHPRWLEHVEGMFGLWQQPVPQIQREGLVCSA
jgi:hypothetical protein